MSMPEQDKEHLRKLLGKMCGHCSDENGYCILKEIFLSRDTQERTLVQCKCVEVLKYSESQKQNREIKWPEAWMIWNDLGYAAKFAEIYDKNPEAEYLDIYFQVVT